MDRVNSAAHPRAKGHSFSEARQHHIPQRHQRQHQYQQPPLEYFQQLQNQQYQLQLQQQLVEQQQLHLQQQQQQVSQQLFMQGQQLPAMLRGLLDFRFDRIVQVVTREVRRIQMETLPTLDRSTAAALDQTVQRRVRPELSALRSQARQAEDLSTSILHRLAALERSVDAIARQLGCDDRLGRQENPPGPGQPKHSQATSKSGPIFSRILNRHHEEDKTSKANSDINEKSCLQKAEKREAVRVQISGSLDETDPKCVYDAASHTETTGDNVTHQTTLDDPCTHQTKPDDRRTHQATPDDRRTYQATPDDTCTHQTTPDDRRTHQTTPDDRRTHQATPDDARTHQTTLDDPCTHQTTPDDRRTHQTTPDDRRTHQTTPDDRRTHQTTPDERHTHQTTPDDPCTHQTTPDERHTHQTTPHDRRTHQTTPDDRRTHQKVTVAEETPPRIRLNHVVPARRTKPTKNKSSAIPDESAEHFTESTQAADQSEKFKSALTNVRQEVWADSVTKLPQRLLVTGISREKRQNELKDKIGIDSSPLSEKLSLGDNASELLVQAMAMEKDMRGRQGRLPRENIPALASPPDELNPECDGGRREEEDSNSLWELEDKPKSPDSFLNPGSVATYTQFGGNRCQYSFDLHVSNFSGHVSKPGKECSSAICQVQRQRVQGSVCFLSSGYLQTWFTMYKTDRRVGRYCSDGDEDGLCLKGALAESCMAGKSKLHRSISDGDGTKLSKSNSCSPKAIVRAVLVDPKGKLPEISIGKGLEVTWNHEVGQVISRRLGLLRYNTITDAGWTNTISVRFCVEMATS